MKNNVEKVIAILDELIENGHAVSISRNSDRLNIFDWWKPQLSVANMEDMRRFLLEAQRQGLNGYCCFKVGASGCSNGMWAYRDNTVSCSPLNSPCIYKSFTPSYNYWSLNPKGDDEWLPKRDEYDKLDTIAKFRSYVKDNGIVFES